MPTQPTKYIYDLMRAAAVARSVPLTLIEALGFVESGFNPLAVGPMIPGGSAQGIMQLTPSVSRALNVRNPFDPPQNIDGAGRLLGQLAKHYDDDYTKVIAAYIWGPNKVDAGNSWPGEVIDYVNKVKLARKFYQDQGTAAPSATTPFERLDYAIGALYALNPAWPRAKELKRIWDEFRRGNAMLPHMITTGLEPHWLAYIKAYDRAPLTDATTPPPWKVEPSLWRELEQDAKMVINVVKKFGKEVGAGLGNAAGAALMIGVLVLLASSRSRRS